MIPMSFRSWILCLLGVLGTLFVICLATPLFTAVVVPMAVIYYFVQVIQQPVVRKATEQNQPVKRPQFYLRICKSTLFSGGVDVFCLLCFRGFMLPHPDSWGDWTLCLDRPYTHTLEKPYQASLSSGHTDTSCVFSIKMSTPLMRILKVFILGLFPIGEFVWITSRFLSVFASYLMLSGGV